MSTPRRASARTRRSNGAAASSRASVRSSAASRRGPPPRRSAGRRRAPPRRRRARRCRARSTAARRFLTLRKACLPSFHRRRHPGSSHRHVSSYERIDFCYGHRLLDYDGVWNYPHGHNAACEVEVRTDGWTSVTWSLTSATSSGWSRVDRSRARSQDDPAPRRPAGPAAAGARRAHLPARQEPTVERIAKLIFDQARALGLDAMGVTAWETPTSFATYGD